MTAFAILPQFLGVFGTGVLASVSPCVYPILPITVGFLSTLSKKRNQRMAVLLYFAGQTISLVVIGFISVQLGEALGFSSELVWVRRLTGSFLILAGIVSFGGKLPVLFVRLNSFFSKGSRFGFANGTANGAMVGPFLMGALGALIASPCTSPLLGGVLVLMATSGSIGHGLLLMISYSLGFSVIFLLLGMGILKTQTIPKSGIWLTRLHHVGAILLILTGVYFLATSI